MVCRAAQEWVRELDTTIAQYDHPRGLRLR
jgi:hypothetical protein